MKLSNLIRNLNSTEGKDSARSKSVSTKEHERVAGSTGDGGSTAPRDSVNIAGASELQSLTAQTLAETPKNETLEELKAAIQEGSYKPNLERLAEQLLVRADIVETGAE